MPCCFRNAIFETVGQLQPQGPVGRPPNNQSPIKVERIEAPSVKVRACAIVASWTLDGSRLQTHDPVMDIERRYLQTGRRARSPGGPPTDWVFAGDAGRPRWQETILGHQLKPAAARAGIGKIGWHTFRHTYSTMPRSAGTDIKVQQELLRHANIQTTTNVYTQAVSEQKRAANSKVVEMVLSPAKTSTAAESEINGSDRGADATVLHIAKRASSD